MRAIFLIFIAILSCNLIIFSGDPIQNSAGGGTNASNGFWFAVGAGLGIGAGFFGSCFTDSWFVTAMTNKLDSIERDLRTCQELNEEHRHTLQNLRFANFFTVASNIDLIKKKDALSKKLTSANARIDRRTKRAALLGISTNSDSDNYFSSDYDSDSNNDFSSDYDPYSDSTQTTIPEPSEPITAGAGGGASAIASPSRDSTVTRIHSMTKEDAEGILCRLQAKQKKIDISFLELSAKYAQRIEAAKKRINKTK